MSLSILTGHFQSNLSSFKKMIQDFKKALGERKTPWDLIILNRIIIVFSLLALILTSTEFVFKRKLVDSIRHGNDHMLYSNMRLVYLVQISSNIRSLVDVANGIE